jgi:spermidine/putrescine-binding protein
MCFLYRTDLVCESSMSWMEFWRPAEDLSGQVTVLDFPGEVIGAALKMRGHSYSSTDPRSLAQARADLWALKPHLLGFNTNDRPLLASGEAVLAVGRNGDAAVLRGTGVPIQGVVPAEGSQIWEDVWAIAAMSSQPETAHDFLNFVLRPMVAAQGADHTRYATGNEAALELLDEAIRRDDSTYPPDDVLGKLEAGLPQDAAGSRPRERLWKNVGPDRG